MDKKEQTGKGAAGQAELPKNSQAVQHDKIQSPYMLKQTPVNPGNLEYDSELYHYFLNNTDNNLHKWHHYFPIYDKHFSRYRGRPVNVLEIGVFRGGSLKMWRNYFGEQANIFGLDIDERCLQYSNEDENIHVIIGDQSDALFMRVLMSKLPTIDILIDDGGHTTKQQIVTFLTCYQKLADNGIYLCEDLHTNYWKRFIDSSETFVDFAKRHVDYLNAWYFKDEASYKTADKMPLFTNTTHSVTFYNSIIVFERSPVKRPVDTLK